MPGISHSENPLAINIDCSEPKGNQFCYCRMKNKAFSSCKSCVNGLCFFFDESPLFAHPNNRCRLQSRKLLGTVSVRCVGEHCHLTLLGRKAPAARAIQRRREKPGGSGDPKPGPSDPRHRPPSCPTGPTAPSSPHLLAQCNSPGAAAAAIEDNA